MEELRSALPLAPVRSDPSTKGSQPPGGLNVTQGSNVISGKNEYVQSNVNQGNFNNSYIDQRTTYIQQNVRVARPWTVPRAVSRLYTGRQEIAQELEKLLRPRDAYTPSEEQQRRLVISGLGGTGKSEVCIKFAHDHRKEYQGVFWIDCKDEKTAQDGFERVGRLCGLTDPDCIASVNAWLSSTGDRWLLIIDNADNPKFDYAVYFPSGEECTVIVTTRNPNSWEKYSTVGRIDLDQLDLYLAKDLLLKAAGRRLQEATPSEIEAAGQIVQELGRHTLAILQAGAYINQSCEVDEYLALYQNKRDRLFKNEREQGYSTYGTVHATFEVSTEHLEGLSSRGAQDAGDALALLTLLAYMHYEGQFELIFGRATEYALFARDKLSKDGEERVMSEDHAAQLPHFLPRMGEGPEGRLRWRRAYQRLKSFSLISVQDGRSTSTMSMHPLVHQWALERQDEVLRKLAWRQASLVLALSCQGNQRYVQIFEAIKSHVRACLRHRNELLIAGTFRQDFAAILLQLAWVKFVMHDDDDLQTILDVIKAPLKADASGVEAENNLSPLTLKLSLLEGQLLERRGNVREAVKVLEKVVHTQEKTVDKGHPDLLASQQALAITYRSNGQIVEAVKLLERVVSIEEKVLEQTHPSLLTSRRALAQVYGSNGQTNEAVEMLEHVVNFEKTLDQAHPDRLASQHALAVAYRSNGKIKKAIKMLEYIAGVMADTFDEIHPSRLSSQLALAGAYRSDGQIEKAIKILEHVVSIRENTLDETHPSRLASQHALAIAYDANDQTTEAIELVQHVVSIKEKTLDEMHPSRLASQHVLAGAYESNGQISEAIKILEQVVSVEAKTLDETHPSRLASQHELARMYHSDGQISKAVEILKHVVRIEERTLDATHPDRIASQHVLAAAQSLSAGMKMK